MKTSGPMLVLLMLVCVFVAHRPSHAQSLQNWLAQVDDLSLPSRIKQVKPSVLPVMCQSSDSMQTRTSHGTGFVVGTMDSIGTRLCIVTCAHILVAERDSLDRPVTLHQDMFVVANRRDGSTRALRVVPVEVNHKLDVAVLALDERARMEAVRDSCFFKFTQPSIVRSRDFLQEGEQVFYLGYPRRRGTGSLNLPLIRSGIVAQLDPRRDYFLVDGFVQSGHSGSPVFVTDGWAEGDTMLWCSYLVGIARGFPPEYGPVLRNVAHVPDSAYVVQYNPGFTAVTPMDSIIPMLERCLGVDFEKARLEHEAQKLR
jgi:hypothetical protein